MSPALSRVRRFLFWFVVFVIVGYVTWAKVESVRLSRAIEEIRARGEPVDYSYWYARQVTAEQREAASLYAQAAAFASEAEAGQQYQANLIDVDLPSGPVMTLDDIAASYRPDAPAMQLLDRATPLDFTEFGEANRGLYDNQITLQRLGQQACLRADVRSARGDAEGAVTALVPCVRLQRTLLRYYRGPHAARVLGSFRILFRHTSPSDPSLAELQRSFAAWSEDDGAVRALLQDRARFISYIDSPSRSLGESAMAALMHPFLTSVTRRRVLSYEEALRVARLPPKARQEAFAEMRRQPMPARRGFLSEFFAPQVYFGPASFTGTLDLTVRRLLLSVLAVERYRRAHQGVPPPSLDALVPAFLPAVPEDPFAGKPLTYRRDADAYVIYSIDANRRDDGGEFYGHGAAIKKHVGPQSPRDLGIRVPLKPTR
jgi:hypothetical protein